MQLEGRPDGPDKLINGSAADTWALGCVLYELLTGTLPFMPKEAVPADEVPSSVHPKARDLWRVQASFYKAHWDWVGSHVFMFPLHACCDHSVIMSTICGIRMAAPHDILHFALLSSLVDCSQRSDVMAVCCFPKLSPSCYRCIETVPVANFLTTTAYCVCKLTAKFDPPAKSAWLFKSCRCKVIGTDMTSPLLHCLFADECCEGIKNAALLPHCMLASSRLSGHHTRLLHCPVACLQINAIKA